jgi:colicin import membrane protein
MVDHDTDLVPPGYRFDVVWRGFNRRQVTKYLDIELGMLATDRDAAVATVCDLVGLLEQNRAETDVLRERLDRVCRAPLSPAAVDERLHRLAELAHDEATAIVAKARETAERLQVTSLERIRHQEERAERKRQQIEDDFLIAMAARRAESMRALADYETTHRAEAERLVREADDVARRRIASATTQVDALRETHRRLAGRLRTVRGLLVRACALLGPPAQT